MIRKVTLRLCSKSKAPAGCWYLRAVTDRAEIGDAQADAAAEANHVHCEDRERELHVRVHHTVQHLRTSDRGSVWGE